MAENLQNDVHQLKKQFEAKTSEIELLESRYRLLDSDHRIFKQRLDAQSHENQRLEVALESQQSEKLDRISDLEKVTAERRALHQRRCEQERRMRHLHNQMLELKGNIRVFVRVRPCNENESAINIDTDETLTVAKPNVKPNARPTSTRFQFDRVLGANLSQADVFEEVEQLVISALDGYNVCIFAYGQTGSGKTYTMEGPPGLEFEDDSQSEHFGIIPRSLHRVFELTEERREYGWEYTLEVSFLEIHNEVIHDLLDRNRNKECNLRQTSNQSKSAESVVFVENLIAVKVSSVKQIGQLMEKARKHRSVATTRCNERSSRSHSIFQLRIGARNTTEELHRESVLSLVDLAGSERVKEAGTDGARLMETKKINASLTQLSTVMMSLGNKVSGHY